MLRQGIQVQARPEKRHEKASSGCEVLFGWMQGQILQRIELELEKSCCGLGRGDGLGGVPVL